MNDVQFFGIQCFFCGGKKCRHEIFENTKKGKGLKIGVKGLNSHFVTDQIIASCRPSEKAIKEYNLYAQFKKINLRAVFNLQEKYEHAKCGDFGGLQKSGFSYDPEKLEKAGFLYFHFPIPDMAPPRSFEYIYNIVIAMDAVANEPKVNGELPKFLVHCHAGLGRTGLIIACYLIFKNYLGTNVPSIIQFLRKKRPNSLQTQGQIKFVHGFKTFLKSEQKMRRTRSNDELGSMHESLYDVNISINFNNQILHSHYNGEEEPFVASLCMEEEKVEIDQSIEPINEDTLESQTEDNTEKIDHIHDIEKEENEVESSLVPIKSAELLKLMNEDAIKKSEELIPNKAETPLTWVNN